MEVEKRKRGRPRKTVPPVFDPGPVDDTSAGGGVGDLYTRDPLEFLLDVMQGKIAVPPEQVRAAIAAAQYVHTRTRDGGKKDTAVEKAKKAATGKFAPAAPPKLVVNNK